MRRLLQGDCVENETGYVSLEGRLRTRCGAAGGLFSSRVAARLISSDQSQRDEDELAVSRMTRTVCRRSQRLRIRRHSSRSPVSSSQRNTRRLSGMFPISVIASITAKQIAPASASLDGVPSRVAAATKHAATVAVMRKGSMLAKRLYTSFSARTWARWSSFQSVG